MNNNLNNNYIQHCWNTQYNMMPDHNPAYRNMMLQHNPGHHNMMPNHNPAHQNMVQNHNSRHRNMMPNQHSGHHNMMPNHNPGHHNMMPNYNPVHHNMMPNHNSGHRYSMPYQIPAHQNMLIMPHNNPEFRKRTNSDSLASPYTVKSKSNIRPKLKRRQQNQNNYTRNHSNIINVQVSMKEENKEDCLRAIKSKSLPPETKNFKLHMSEQEFAHRLSRHIIDPNQLRDYGYPVESVEHKGCIEFLRMFVNYTPASRHITNISSVDNSDNLSTDSGCDTKTGDSSPISIFSEFNDCERECTRCQRTFHVTNAGEYLTHESCTYHPGRIERWSSTPKYSCCNRYENTEGCCYNALHVWSGTVAGLNGPYNDFVQTRPRYLDASGCRQQSNPTKVYTLDCEMSFTGRGLDVTKISVVNYEGQSVYEHYVRPDTEIIDYNTRFSGITENDLNPNSGNSIKSLPEIHRDLLQLFDTDTILIGHGLENDLRALRLVHKRIVDTAIVYPHPRGFPYKKGLKTLTLDILKREIQCGDEGHSCLEDAQATLELILFKVHEERQQERL